MMTSNGIIELSCRTVWANKQGTQLYSVVMALHNCSQMLACPLEHCQPSTLAYSPSSTQYTEPTSLLFLAATPVSCWVLFLLHCRRDPCLQLLFPAKSSRYHKDWHCSKSTYRLPLSFKSHLIQSLRCLSVITTSVMFNGGASWITHFNQWLLLILYLRIVMSIAY